MIKQLCKKAAIKKLHASYYIHVINSLLCLYNWEWSFRRIDLPSHPQCVRICGALFKSQWMEGNFQQRRPGHSWVSIFLSAPRDPLLPCTMPPFHPACIPIHHVEEWWREKPFLIRCSTHISILTNLYIDPLKPLCEFIYRFSLFI